MKKPMFSLTTGKAPVNRRFWRLFAAKICKPGKLPAAALLLVLLLVLFLVYSCSAKAQGSSPADTAKIFAEAGIPLLKEKVSGRNFTLPLASPEGETQSLDSLKGKVVFLNFWATWCGPCRSEMPSMEVLYNKYKDQGLDILAVNCMENRADVVSFLTNNKLSFPAVLDTGGDVSRSYGIQAIPTTFIIDREGKITIRLVGSINWDTPKIHAAMERLLSE